MRCATGLTTVASSGDDGSSACYHRPRTKPANTPELVSSQPRGAQVYVVLAG